MENPLDQLIRRMARLPGLGPRSARRAVLHLLRNRDALMLPLAAELNQVARGIKACVDCGNFDTDDTCRICRNTGRDRSRICVVEDIADLWAMERTAIYSGLYHVLGGVMSAIDGVGPEDLRIPLWWIALLLMMCRKSSLQLRQRWMARQPAIISPKN